MNAKVKQLGLKNTHFVNPHGLHDPQHFTSARDLATIARAFTQVPFLNSVVRMKTTTIGGNAKIGPVRLLQNRNKLLFRWPALRWTQNWFNQRSGPLFDCHRDWSAIRKPANRGDLLSLW